MIILVCSRTLVKRDVGTDVACAFTYVDPRSIRYVDDGDAAGVMAAMLRSDCLQLFDRLDSPSHRSQCDCSKMFICKYGREDSTFDALDMDPHSFCLN